MKELFLASFHNMEHGVYQITLLESGNIIDALGCGTWADCFFV